MKRTAVRYDHLVGKPFVRGGFDVDAHGGLDCEGVAATVCREAGIPYGVHGFPFRPRMETTQCDALGPTGKTAQLPETPAGTAWMLVGRDLARATNLFDVVVSMSSCQGFKRGEYHVDIVVDEKGPELLSATKGRGVYSRRPNLAFARRVIGVYRLPSHFLKGRAQ